LLPIVLVLVRAGSCLGGVSSMVYIYAAPRPG
jgi:hypothetical protein